MHVSTHIISKETLPSMSRQPFICLPYGVIVQQRQRRSRRQVSAYFPKR